MSERGSPTTPWRRTRAVWASAAHAMTTPWVYAYVAVEVAAALAASALARSATALVVLDPVLFFPVFAFHLYHRRTARLVALASLWGIWKSALFVAVVWASGDAMGPIVSGGPAYHADTLNWILHGEGTIAHPEVFAWRHLWGLGHVSLTSVASAGLTTLIGGARELNIMNYHVARLLGSAPRPWPVVLFGWPVWSVLRGWAYLFVMLGAGPLFFCIVRRRRPRWRQLAPWLAAGCGLAGVDLGLKILLAPWWRHLLLLAW